MREGRVASVLGASDARRVWLELDVPVRDWVSPWITCVCGLIPEELLVRGRMRRYGTADGVVGAREEGLDTPVVVEHAGV
jgi:hypothetical protein